MILSEVGIVIKKRSKPPFALLAVGIVSCNKNQLIQDFILDTPAKCLILDPEDWHTMHNFSGNAILMVLASEAFNPDDYIYQQY